jgi:hypothetical protein
MEEGVGIPANRDHDHGARQHCRAGGYSAVIWKIDGLYLGIMSGLAATFVFWWATFFIAFRVWRLIRARRSRS